MTTPGEIELHGVQVLVIDPRRRKLYREMGCTRLPAAAVKSHEPLADALVKRCGALLYVLEFRGVGGLALGESLAQLFQLLSQSHGTLPHNGVCKAGRADSYSATPANSAFRLLRMFASS
jgi:hypothetical protein